MTAAVLGDFGVSVSASESTWTVEGVLVTPRHSLVIEPDASNATYFLSAKKSTLPGGTASSIASMQS